MGMDINPVAVPSRRVVRSPEHQFYIKHRPYLIQPFMLAPVLPGETLKNLSLQSRVVLDPIKNPLIGWWIEHYFFYVKHRDLDARDTFSAMMLDPTTSMSGLTQTSARSAPYYTYLNAVKWAELCTKRVVEEYFVDDGQATTTMDGLYQQKISNEMWTDSLTAAADMPSSDGPLADDGEPIDTQALDKAFTLWQFLVANQMTQMSYEDYLRSNGVRSARIELHRPELIRMSRNWSYPSNTVDATGAVSSTVSWAVSERADKDRFFSEPGFILGLSTVRPKVYLKGLSGSLAGALDNAIAWLPALLRNEVYASLREFASGTGPVPGAAANYWVDLRDLFVHGDQFLMGALSETDQNLVSLPTSGVAHEYATTGDIDALFVSGTADQARQDGTVRLNILGTQVDHT